MTVGGHHRMLIRVHLDHIAFLDRSVAAVEDEIQAALDAIPAAQGVSADGIRCAGPGPDAAVLPAAERLAEIPGVSLDLARAIIAETGLDMARFPTAAHLVSWACLSRSPASPAPAAASRRRDRATTTSRATAPRPPPVPPALTPSPASGSAACPGA